MNSTCDLCIQNKNNYNVIKYENKLYTCTCTILRMTIQYYKTCYIECFDTFLLEQFKLHKKCVSIFYNQKMIHMYYFLNDSNIEINIIPKNQYKVIDSIFMNSYNTLIKNTKNKNSLITNLKIQMNDLKIKLQNISKIELIEKITNKYNKIKAEQLYLLQKNKQLHNEIKQLKEELKIIKQ
jgi:hypothetical protein